MKILELTNYSSGICGVWTRVKQESELLSEKHEVRVFSSNATKGSSEIASPNESIGNINIQRFPFTKLGGESFMYWFNKQAQKEALEYEPDIIIAHSYRQLHTTKALRVAKKLKKNGKECKLFLVTHAPFVENNSTRTLIQKIVVKFYDKFIAPKYINRFDKIITITKWENPFLQELRVSLDNIEYVPNGLFNDFFIISNNIKEEDKILFLGRISPIKDLETLIKAMSLIENKSIILEIVGPAEEDYLRKLKQLINELDLNDKIIFIPPICKLKEKIKKIDSCKVFVLPSFREAMPQSLIEAMARGKVVIASDNPGCKALIEDGKNGFLFPIGDEQKLAEKIMFALKSDNISIKENAKKSVEQFKWSKLIKKLENMF